MPKTLTKFAIDSLGNLVYRKNGRKVPKNIADMYRIDIKKKSVYKGTKRIGTIGKGTKKEQRIIEEKAKNREKRVEREYKRAKKILAKAELPSVPKSKKTPPPNIDFEEIAMEEPPSIPGFSIEDLSNLYEAYPAISKLEPGLLDIDQRGLINFGKSLDTCLKSGYITQEEADKYLKIYVNGSRKERGKLWKELYKYYKDVGYVPSD